MAEIRNIGIFAHVDAGKTTLTEQMLLCSGFIRKAGRVDSGTAFTDSLPVEKRRGISVKAASVCFNWRGVKINLIDTPGHTDFSAEIERSMWAPDGAVLVIDAAEGVQPQTEALAEALAGFSTPYLIFLNKTDRIGADVSAALGDIKTRLKISAPPLFDEGELTEQVCALDDGLTERWLEGEALPETEIREKLIEFTRQGRLHPVLKGSALKGEGIAELLNAVTQLLPPPLPGNGGLCAGVFSACSDRQMGRGLWVRVFSGRLGNRQALDIPRGIDPVSGETLSEQRKITRLRDAAGNDTDALNAGDVGTVYGLGGFEIGGTLGNEALLPRVLNMGSLRSPLLTVQVNAENPEDSERLRLACTELSGEDPLLKCEYIRSTGELILRVMGKIQLEIIGETLLTRYGISARFSDPAVIYKETIASPARGYVAYTMPKPCWAIMEFQLSPAPRGSGVTFKNLVPPGQILPRYIGQVRQALPKALSQGRLGWEVTDVEITLTDGNHHQFHTHPLDFIVATPMGIQDGLRRGGSALLEPLIEARFSLPEENLGRLISDVNLMRGSVTETSLLNGRVNARAILPVSSSLDYSVTLACYTSGRGSMTTRPAGCRDCPLSLGATAPRRGTDPLDTAKYILAARSALEGDIFDY